MNYNKITNIVLSGIDTNDYPDFSDTFIESAEYDGKQMTDSQLDEINQDTDFIAECILNKIF